jgi:hypothetical protein
MTAQNFTVEDAGRLLGLADQFIDDWEANQGKDDPECQERRTEWDTIRPMLAAAPELLRQLEHLAGACERFAPEILTTEARAAIAQARRQP